MLLMINTFTVKSFILLLLILVDNMDQLPYDLNVSELAINKMRCS